MLTRDVLPDGPALVVAEGNDARGLGLGEKDPPAVLGHPDVAELRPALRIHAHRGPQIDLRRLKPVRTHVPPPLEELRLPLLEGALQAAVLAEVDVVRDPLRVVDRGHHTLLRSNSLRWPVPYTTSAPFGPAAFGRWKIQFCQADSRPKILVSSVSGPAKRCCASMPVSASGLNDARSSTAMRSSSSQSMSSKVNVTRPAAAAWAACSGTPASRRAAASSASRPQNLLASLESPFAIGSGPMFMPVSCSVAGGGPVSLSWRRWPSSM